MGKIYDALEKFEAEKSVKKVKSAERSHIAPSQPSDLQISTNPPPVRQKHAFDENINKNLVTLNDPLGFESEQFKILRTMLLFPQSGERARTIMVTSALPEEGKSFVAANLAVSLAQNINEYVLLIDGDIRHPTQHSIFGFHNVPGLSEHLSKGAQIPDLLLKTRVNKLSLLPGGTPPPNPSELLSSESMSALIREAKERYNDRYIVLDTPPPKMTAETAALARQMDGIILVIKSGSTPKKLAEELVELFGKDKILGIVMNHHNIQGSKYYGYGKYGTYSGYHQKKK